MRGFLRSGSAFWFLVIGLVVGFSAAGLWPNTPLHTTATDKIDTFGIATGAVEDYEAVYFLDYLTGDLRAFVIGRGSNGNFGVLASGHANVLQDMKSDAGKSPKLLMVTGNNDLLRGGRQGNLMPSRASIYIAEITSGQCVVYSFPFNTTAHARGVATPPSQLMPVASFKFRNATLKGKGDE